MKHRYINEWIVIAERMEKFTAKQYLITISMIRINSIANISDKKGQLRSIDNTRRIIQCSNLPQQCKNFLLCKLSMQLVSLELYPSSCEPATGFHESRRYNKFYE